MPSIRERNRRLIVEAASAEFADKGFEASTVEDIAARAGLPKANVHYYFETKRNLYACVLDRVMEPLLRAARSLDPEALPKDALERYVQAKIGVIRQYPHACKVLVREMLHGAHHLSGSHAEAMREIARQNLGCLNTWMDRGLIARTAPEHLLLFLWSMPMAHIRFAPQGSRLAQSRTHDGHDLQPSASALTRMLLRGLQPGRPEQRIAI